MSKTPKTLQEAVIHFADAENCREFMANLRWPDGKPKCPACGSENVSYLPNAKVYKCFAKPAHDKVKFSLKVGTIFEESPIGLEKWLPVMWMLVNCKNGVSSWEIHRAVGVTQKTAWFMLQRGRLAMQDDLTGGKLGGDETDRRQAPKLCRTHRQAGGRNAASSQLRNTGGFRAGKEEILRERMPLGVEIQCPE